jgi:hypothetical protein
MKQTRDKTADFLLRQLPLLRRMGDYEHKRDADRWEQIIRQHAVPEPQPMAVNFATTAEPTGPAMDR